MPGQVFADSALRTDSSTDDKAGRQNATFLNIETQKRQHISRIVKRYLWMDRELGGRIEGRDAETKAARCNMTERERGRGREAEICR